jgi:hypothetical protein
MISSTLGDDIERQCKLYFRTFHNWVPFINEKDFWQKFYSSQRNSNPAFSILAISIYLLVYSPTKTSGEISFVDSAYSTVKACWLWLRNNTEASIIQIQTGLLLATYEHGQTWDEASDASMSVCIKLGYSLGLHRTLRQKVVTGLGDPEAQDTCRRLWWSILIHER